MSVKKKTWTTLIGILLAPVLMYYSLVQGFTETMQKITDDIESRGREQAPDATAAPFPFIDIPDPARQTKGQGAIKSDHRLSPLREAGRASSSVPTRQASSRPVSKFQPHPK